MLQPPFSPWEITPVQLFVLSFTSPFSKLALMRAPQLAREAQTRQALRLWRGITLFKKS